VTIAPVRLAEEAISESSTQALIEEARQHRRRRLAVWALAAIAVAGIFLGIVASHNSGRGALTRVPLRHGVPNPAFTGPFSQTRSKLLEYVLPTSGADITAGEKFMDRMQGLAAEDKAACMNQAGYPSTVTYRSGSFAVGNNTQFPPIAELAANGFVLRAVDEPYYGVRYVGKPLSDSATSKHVATRTKCEASSQRPLNALIEQTQPLASVWQGRIIPHINQNKAFKKALVGWSACISQGGVFATSINGYFQNIGPILRDDASTPAKDYRRFGELYARCLAPAEVVRDRLRVGARIVFEQQHASQIAALTNSLHQLVG
jgi:hypothetical protein